MTAADADASLDRLNQELADRGVQCEVCTVGGAVLSLVFASDPPTRNVKALFQSARLLSEAAAAVADDQGLPDAWLPTSVRDRLATGGLAGSLELSHLRIFEARPEYLLAMKCAALAVNQGPSDRDDIRFLLRLLNLHDSAAALEVVMRYFNERQVPADLDSLLEGLVSA